jgi:uncharacterized protein GlcG (DUF336 family)
MSNKTLSMLGAAGFLMAASSALAAGSGLPGDHGRPGDGIMAVTQAAPAQQPQQPQPTPPTVARAPDVGVAVKAAEAIAAGCKQFALGVTVVNAEGAPILVYIPNGSNASHGYTALRKAITAITFKTPTSALVTKAQQDPDFAAKIKADPNLMAYSGGILLKSGDEIIGAIGVSGAEPGHHDEECGLKGLDKVKGEMK